MIIPLFKISESTKKGFLIIAALFIIILLVFGFIYLLIAKHMQKNAKKIDDYMVDLCRYRIVNDSIQFVEAVKFYEQRNLHRNIKWPFRILLLSLIIVFLYCLFSEPGTTKKVFTSFFNLFPRFKWQTVGSINEELKEAGKPLIVGISWMPVSLIPTVTFKKIIANDINLYISSIFYILLIVLLWKVASYALSYYARIKRGREKAKTVFEKSLDQFNIYAIDNPITSLPTQTTMENSNLNSSENEQ